VNFAIVRVVLTTALGYFCSRQLPGLLGINPLWGVAGLTASAGFAGWVEFLLLRSSMNRRIGRIEFPTSYFVRLWLSAVIAAAVAWGVKLALHPQRPWIAGALILSPYAAVYLGCTALFGVEQAGALVRRVLKSLA
jgi:putative peptidoglycan lipid II flippase